MVALAISDVSVRDENDEDKEDNGVIGDNEAENVDACEPEDADRENDRSEGEADVES